MAAARVRDLTGSRRTAFRALDALDSLERSGRDLERPRYIISIAAELASCHPRTLRIYEQEGLLAPRRRNNLRLYSEADIQRVRIIRFLTQRQRVNLAGVKVILQLEALGKIRVSDLLDDARSQDHETTTDEAAEHPERRRANGQRPAGRVERRSM
jgi:MerR family transcriptional regulator/heat shock protein HspR